MYENLHPVRQTYMKLFVYPLPGTTIPEPVFLCSIEPPSASFQNALDTALAELAREDPSLRVINDQETGQIILAGKSLFIVPEYILDYMGIGQ